MHDPAGRPRTWTEHGLILSMLAAGSVALLLIMAQSDASPTGPAEVVSELPADESDGGRGTGPESLDLADFELSKAPVGDRLGLRPPGVEIQARVVVGRSDPGAMRDLSTVGSNTYSWPGRELSVTGTPEDLARLLETGTVAQIEPDYAPKLLQASEGVSVLGADTWHADGHQGEGVKIAIIDGGFQGYPSLVGNELPGRLFVTSFRSDGAVEAGISHGTAVAEIVHEMAPQAELHLVTIEGESNMAAAVDYVLAAGIDVVNTSLGWTQGPFDGSSPVSQEVARATAAGVTWVTAVGNEAMNHWGGAFVDTDGDDIGEFLPAAAEIEYFDVAPWGIFWADLNWASSNADLDMCLWELTIDGPEYVDCASGYQLPGDRPLEPLVWGNPTGNWAVYGVSMHRYSGDPGRVDLYVTGVERIDYFEPVQSLSAPADVESAIAVGATPWTSPTSIEPFSSQGPNALGQIKPDFVAPDRVSTWSYGVSGFPGTSASTPHVAGLAALMVEQNPSGSPADIKSMLRDRAVPIPAGSGKNNTYGWGLAAAGPVPVPPPPPPGPCPDRAECDRLVVVDSGSQIHLYDRISPDATIADFWYGVPGDTPLMGDWDGDGVATPGMYRASNGFVYLRNSNTGGFADEEFFYGIAGDIPIVGDWDNDGFDTLGVYRNGQVYIKNTLDTGIADFQYWYGLPGDRPFTGDFDGHGVDTVGLYRESSGFVYFRNTLDTGIADFDFFYGTPSDRILAGDWNGTGVDTVAVYRPSNGMVYFRMTNTQGFADYELDIGTGYIAALTAH